MRRSPDMRPVLVALCLLVASAAAHGARAIHWSNSLPRALEMARASNKLVFVDFFTDECTYCKLMDRTTYKDASIVSRVSGMFPVKLNAEHGGYFLARKYGIWAYPTLLFMNADGEVEFRISGMVPTKMMLSAIQHAGALHSRFLGLQARVRSNPGDTDATYQLVSVYAGRGDLRGVFTWLKRLESADPRSVSGKLPKAYDMAGSLVLRTGHPAEAVPILQKAISTGRDAYDLAFAHLALAECYESGLKFKRAAAELSIVIASPRAPKELKSRARQGVAQMKHEGVI